MALARPETTPGQQNVPLSASGQYRYTALPALQDGYVQARLTLKQDTSGGAGRVTGDETLDRTVDEAQLLFQPDPAQAQGVIDFSHVFQLAPGALELNPGDSDAFLHGAHRHRFRRAHPTVEQWGGVHAALTDPGRRSYNRAAQTRRRREGRISVGTSSGMVRPLAFERAVATELPFEPFLAQGGLGDYRFTLETQRNGEWVSVSNDVNIKLTVPVTATPPGEIAAAPGEVRRRRSATPAPETSEPVPAGTPPQVPTRRPTPVGATGPEPTATPTAAVVASAATATRTRNGRGERLLGRSLQLGAGRMHESALGRAECDRGLFQRQSG